MDYNMPMAAKQHTPSEYTYNRRPKGLYDTSRPYFNSGCSSCLSIFLILMGAGLLGLEIALIVLEGHVARTYVCGIWAGILAMITGALCATAAKSQKTKVIIGMIGFSLLSLGAGIAVGFISYEAIDWDADDFGDGDGKRIARLACEAVRAFCALWVILMSFAAIIIGLKSMCSSDEEVIYHKFHDEYSKNTPVPPHYIQSNTLTKDDPLSEPEPEEVNEEPIRKKKQNETKATPRPTEEHPHAYENHLMAESPEQRDKRWGSHGKEVEPVQKKDDYGPLPSANPNTKRHASIPNVDEPNTLYVPSNTGFVMVKSKNSAPNSVIGGSMNNINAASTSPPTAAPAVAPVSTPNLAPADNYDTAKGQLPATHYYEPSPATTVVGAQTPGTTVQTAGYRPPSPGKGKRSRSPSPKRKRTPSPKRHSRRRSPSPGKGKRSRTPSPKRKRTPSPKRHSRRRSPKRKASPKRRSRSPSPVEYAGYD